MSQLSPTEHRTIVVVDVADFTNPDRNVTDMLAMQEGLYEVLKTAFAESGVDFDSCTSEDRGDGALILVPADVSKSQLADLLPDRLVAAVRRYNFTRKETARFKLRVGLHAGDIRRNDKGWVGHAVNLAFRILDAAEAKTALAQSDGVVALIVSNHFFTEVIEQDPGTAPDTYRRIPVRVKKFSADAWLRLPGSTVAVNAAPAPAVTQPDDIARPIDGSFADDAVLGVIPGEDLQKLHGWLARVEVPHLTTLVSRAAGPAIPVPRRSSAWDVFTYLSDFNASPDGVPPALSFLQLLAAEVDDPVGGTLMAWVEQQARRLRLGAALADRRNDRPPIPEEPHLNLVIALEPDSIEPERRCALSFWRQDDPLVWPPARGGVLEVGVDDLEFRVDDVLLDAERVWSGQAISAAVEFLLPRSLLNLPIRQWRKEHDSGDPRPLAFDYQLTFRSLERMRATHWHRAWHLRWDSMLKNPSIDRVHPFGVHPFGATQYEEHPIDAVLSDPHWVGLVMAEPPSPRPEPDAGPDELTAALRAGLPLIFWHPAAGVDDLRELVRWLLAGENGFLDLPARHKSACLSSTLPFNNSLARDLVVMWDDPKRLIVLDQPSIPSQR